MNKKIFKYLSVLLVATLFSTLLPMGILAEQKDAGQIATISDTPSILGFPSSDRSSFKTELINRMTYDYSNLIDGQEAQMDSFRNATLTAMDPSSTLDPRWDSLLSGMITEQMKTNCGSEIAAKKEAANVIYGFASLYFCGRSNINTAVDRFESSTLTSLETLLGASVSGSACTKLMDELRAKFSYEIQLSQFYNTARQLFFLSNTKSYTDILHEHMIKSVYNIFASTADADLLALKTKINQATNWLPDSETDSDSFIDKVYELSGIIDASYKCSAVSSNVVSFNNEEYAGMPAIKFYMAPKVGVTQTYNRGTLYIKKGDTNEYRIFTAALNKASVDLSGKMEYYSSDNTKLGVSVNSETIDGVIQYFIALNAKEYTPTEPVKIVGYRNAMSGDGNDNSPEKAVVEFNVVVNNGEIANTAPTDIALSKTSVNENSPIGTTIGAFSTTDADAGQTFTYQLAPGDGATDNNKFTIAGDTIRTNTLFNFEQASSYSVRIKVTDNGFPAGSFEKKFTISINDINEAPSDLVLSQNIANENDVSFEIGTLSALDSDFASQLTYSVVGGDIALFTVVGDKLKTQSALDFETNNSHLVRIQVTDNGTPQLSFEKTFTINVKDMNDSPTDITISNDKIDEQMPIGSFVGSLKGVDVDTGSQLTYEILNSNEFLATGIDGSQVKTKVAFEYESPIKQYTIRVRVTDNGDSLFGTAKLTYEKDITILINNINELPGTIALSNRTIEENNQVNAVIGALSVMDPENDTPVYSIVAGFGDAEVFDISAASLRAKNALNFEAKCQYVVKVRATFADNRYIEQVFSIDVTNQNEAPSNVAISNTTVSEMLAQGTVVGILSATDQDNGDVSTMVYEIQGISQEFEIIGNRLITKKVFDYETMPKTYSLTIIAKDTGNLSSTLNATIAITDSADDGYITISTNTVDETIINANIGTLSVVGAIGTFTYEIVPGFGDASLFTIEGNTLKNTQKLNFESKNKYSVKIKATLGSVVIQNELLIFSLDVNEAPEDLSLSKLDVDENAENGKVVGRFAAVDHDGDSSYQFTIDTQEIAGAFVIDGRTLKTNTNLNFEAKTSYRVTVKATDPTKPTNFFTKEFTITVNNLNEAPTDVSLVGTTVVENMPVGTNVGTFATTDEDAGASFTYTLVSGYGDNAQFTIVGNELKAALIFNYEAKSVYSIKVRSTDNGGLYHEKIINISILDQNDAPTKVYLSSNTVLENKANEMIGQLTGVDPDAGNTLTYALLPNVYDNQKFAIVSNAGKYYLSNTIAFNYDINQYFTVKIRATDSGVPAKSIDQIFTVYVQMNRVIIEGAVSADGSYSVNKKIVLEYSPSGTEGTYVDKGYYYSGYSGEFLFRAIDVGSYKVRAEGDAQYKVTYAKDIGGINKVISVANADLQNGATFNQNNIALDPKYIPYGRLKVTATKGAMPAADALVSVRSTVTGKEYSGKTDANGICIVYDILTTDNATAPVTYSVRLDTDEYSETKSVDIHYTNDAPDEVVFSNNDYDLVTGKVTKNTVAVEKRYVRAISQTDGKVFVGATNALGEYAINVKKGLSYKIKPDLEVGECVLEKNSIPAGSTNVDFDIYTGVIVKGTVTDVETLQNIAGLQISIVIPKGNLNPQDKTLYALTDENGNYAFPAEFGVGTYTITTATSLLYKSTTNTVTVSQSALDNKTDIVKNIAIRSEVQPGTNPFSMENGNNRIAINGSNITYQGGKVWFTVSYKNEGIAGISNVKFTVDVPAGFTVSNGSTTKVVDRLVKGGEGKYSFELTVPQNFVGDAFSLSAYAQFGSSKVLIGNQGVSVISATINVPGTASKGETITVSGESMNGSNITIYRNGKVVANTVVKGRFYSAKVTMSDVAGDYVFMAKSENSGQSVVTFSRICKVLEGAPVTMGNNLRVNYNMNIWWAPNDINSVLSIGRNGYANTYLLHTPGMPNTLKYRIGIPLSGVVNGNTVNIIQSIGYPISTRISKSATLGENGCYWAEFDIDMRRGGTTPFYVEVKTSEGSYRLNKLALMLDIIMDPGGYVYDENTGERIQGAEVLLKVKNESGTWEIWEAEDYGQSNPLTSDVQGLYSWNVPNGQYAIYVKKDGYNYDEYAIVEEYKNESGNVESIVVPPPRMDVNLPLRNTTPAHIVSITPENGSGLSKDGYVEIKYDKPIKTSTVTGSTFKVLDESNNPVAGTFQFEDGNKTIRFMPSSPLANGFRYSVVIDGVEDMVPAKSGASIYMPVSDFTFAVDGEKVIEYLVASVKNNDTIFNDGYVKVGFSKDLDFKTVNKDNIKLATSAGAVEYSIEQVVGSGDMIQVIPDVININVEYTLTVTTGVKDVDGNPLKEIYTFKFEKTSRTGGGSGSYTDSSKDLVGKAMSGKVKLDEFTAEIPAGAFETNTTVSVTAVTGSEVDKYKTDDTISRISGIYNLTNNKTSDAIKKMTITLKYDKSKVTDPSKLAIYYYDDATGKWISIGGTVDPISGTVTAETDKFGAFALFEDKEDVKPEVLFTDIGGHWAQEHINKLAKLGIINGYKQADGTFKFMPDEKITREEFAKLIVLTLNIKLDASALPFEDAGSISDWAKPYVAAAFKAGIVKGSLDGDKLYMMPDKTISRVEVAAIIGRAVKSAKAAEIRFSDKDSIPAWAINDLAMAVDKGIINGYPDGTFKPSDNTTRAEAAKMLVTMLEAK